MREEGGKSQLPRVIVWEEMNISSFPRVFVSKTSNFPCQRELRGSNHAQTAAKILFARHLYVISIFPIQNTREIHENTSFSLFS